MQGCGMFSLGLQLNVQTFHSFATLTTQELPQLVGCQDAAPEPTQTAKMAKTPHARRGPTVASLGRDENQQESVSLEEQDSLTSISYYA